MAGLFAALPAMTKNHWPERAGHFNVHGTAQTGTMSDLCHWEPPEP
jgi:hypothetical protein